MMITIPDSSKPSKRLLFAPFKFRIIGPNILKFLSAIISILALVSLCFISSFPNLSRSLTHAPRREFINGVVAHEDKTNISHILFGIAASAATWSRRRHYCELWWKPNTTRGFVWLDQQPREIWPEASPPYKVSADTARFKYTCWYGSRSAVRIARIVKESFDLGFQNVRWFVMGDDDTVFLTHNLVSVLNKYDHNRMYYIGGVSESVEQDVVHSYTMGYGGGGFAISRPLAAELVRILDRCIDRYSAFYGSDQKIGGCMSELGVPLTRELGFHQLIVKGSTTSVQSAGFFGKSVKKVRESKISCEKYKVVAEVDEKKQTENDRWKGLVTDISDDQQDITRGKGMVDTLFQAPVGAGTHNAVLSSYDYLTAGLRQYQFDNNVNGYYIAPAFMDKLTVHIAKNFLNLPNIKVPLILGIWGGKGQGKSFQCELVFSKMGINPIMMSAGELESGNAGEPAKLIRQRYREAADRIGKGKMCVLFINDLDAGAGRFGGGTQYTVNNQMVNATLMNIADSPTNVQLPGMYNKQENPRVPVIATGNDFSTLYAPLIRDGRMEKFYWAPTREDRIGVCSGIFRTDNVPVDDLVHLVDTFPGQSIDFFGAVRARVYDDEVRKWIARVGVENMGSKLVNSREKMPEFEQPKMSVAKLIEYGNMLVQEQQNVKRIQLSHHYLNHTNEEEEEDALNNSNPP